MLLSSEPIVSARCTRRPASTRRPGARTRSSRLRRSTGLGSPSAAWRTSRSISRCRNQRNATAASSSRQDRQRLGDQPADGLGQPVVAQPAARQVGQLPHHCLGVREVRERSWRQAEHARDATRRRRQGQTEFATLRRVTNRPQNHRRTTCRPRSSRSSPRSCVTVAAGAAFAEPPETVGGHPERLRACTSSLLLVLIPRRRCSLLICLLVYLPSMIASGDELPAGPGLAQRGRVVRRPARRSRDGRHRRHQAAGRQRRRPGRRTEWRQWQLVTPSPPASATRSTRRSATRRRCAASSSRSSSAAPRARPGRSPSGCTPRCAAPGPLGAGPGRPGRPAARDRHRRRRRTGRSTTAEVELAVLTMKTAFAAGDLVGGITRGVQQLAEHARRPQVRHDA